MLLAWQRGRFANTQVEQTRAVKKPHLLKNMAGDEWVGNRLWRDFASPMHTSFFTVRGVNLIYAPHVLTQFSCSKQAKQ